MAHSPGPDYSSIHDLKVTNDQIKTWLSKALDAGFTCHKKKNNHIQVRSPDGKTTFQVTSSKVEGRTLQEYRQKFKRAGIEV